jgi:hypothetical protein
VSVPASVEEVHALFDPLWADVNDLQRQDAIPLLAHYTSIATLEQILANDEIWLSNPLLMNDLEELRYGIATGVNLFLGSTIIREACGRTDRYDLLRASFQQAYENLNFKDAFDIYALCFSEHDKDDPDGLLSMWRGYGGNGKGVAIVFDTSSVPFVDTSPFIINRVHYDTSVRRESWINAKLAEFAEIVSRSQIRDDLLFVAASSLFERIKIFSLFTKHIGFREEREWRLVYLKERDRNGRLFSMLDYFISKRGIEPKLKFKIGPVDGVTGGPLNLSMLVNRIVVGPSASSAIEIHALRRMLERVGKPDLLGRIVRSSTPFRPI